MNISQIAFSGSFVQVKVGKDSDNEVKTFEGDDNIFVESQGRAVVNSGENNDSVTIQILDGCVSQINTEDGDDSLSVRIPKSNGGNTELTAQLGPGDDRAYIDPGNPGKIAISGGEGQDKAYVGIYSGVPYEVYLGENIPDDLGDHYVVLEDIETVKLLSDKKEEFLGAGRVAIVYRTEA